MAVDLPQTYSFLCGLRVICVPILVQIAPGVPEFRNTYPILSFIILHLIAVDLPYTYSFLSGYRVICIPIQVQIAPVAAEFRNIFSPLYNSAPKGASVTICLQFPLWVVRNMCTDFSSNFSRSSRVLKYFFIISLYTLLRS